jgi:hypothetical protein
LSANGEPQTYQNVRTIRHSFQNPNTVRRRKAPRYPNTVRRRKAPRYPNTVRRRKAPR